MGRGRYKGRSKDGAWTKKQRKAPGREDMSRSRGYLCMRRKMVREERRRQT